MINNSVFEDSTSSLVAAARADLTEALLRGELSREDYEDLLVLTNKKINRDGKRK
jgi:hypothetical protein